MADDTPPASLEDVFLTPKELAVRWRCDIGTLANMRHRGEGVTYLRLPSGRILYRVADVLTVETTGRRGFSWHRLEAALAAYPGMAPRDLGKMMAHVRRVMVPRD